MQTRKSIRSAGISYSPWQKFQRGRALASAKAFRALKKQRRDIVIEINQKETDLNNTQARLREFDRWSRPKNTTEFLVNKKYEGIYSRELNRLYSRKANLDRQIVLGKDKAWDKIQRVQQKTRKRRAKGTWPQRRWIKEVKAGEEKN